MTATRQRLVELLEELTGQKAPFPDAPVSGAFHLLEEGRGLGWSQLNEVLLLLGFDRVSSAFFQYLVDGTTEYGPGSAIASLDELESSVRQVQKLALLVYGNVKYSFKTLSRDTELLEEYLDSLAPVDSSAFRHRHEPVLAREEIPPNKTFLLGYLVEREINERLALNPEDPEALALQRDREDAVRAGRSNQDAYLASDHLDVYVATSMRQRHEFLLVSRLTKEIFEHKQLRELNLRWFDPTQAYCPDRIDKGLAEALMLKRAKCTVYFAQESETLGKDSELASTLAQGKPVIAYVPGGRQDEVDTMLADLRSAYPDRSERKIILDQLRVFSPELAWEDTGIRRSIDELEGADISILRQRLYTEVQKKCDKRASTLKETHPLGIQVNLDSGVANGVLVVRSVEQCAKLLYRIVTRTTEFDLEFAEKFGTRYILLREKISGCIFRVVTGDEMLTNAFWNFYLVPEP